MKIVLDDDGAVIESTCGPLASIIVSNDVERGLDTMTEIKTIR